MGKTKQRNVRVLDKQVHPATTADVPSEEHPTDASETKEVDTKKEVCIGLDISTSVVGICVLDKATSNLEKLTYVKLSKFKNEYDKADNMDWSWLDPSWTISKVFIEEAAKKFSPGFSSADTIMTLGRFNGIISYETYKRTKIIPEMVNVRSARKVLGIKVNYADKSLSTKEKVLKLVAGLNPTFPWYLRISNAGKFKGQTIYDAVNQDMADAWVICKGGQILTK